MEAATEQKMATWIEQVFKQLGEFSESTVDVETKSLTVDKLPWPLTDLHTGSRVGFVFRATDGEPAGSCGVVMDRRLVIDLAGHMRMLPPEEIEEKVAPENGPIDDGDIEGLTELGDLITGVINKLSIGDEDSGFHIDLVGVHSPAGAPAKAAFADELPTYTISVSKGEGTYSVCVFAIDAVIEKWLRIDREAEAQAKGVAEAARVAPRAMVDLPIPEPGVQPWLVIDAAPEDGNLLGTFLHEREHPVVVVESLDAAIETLKTYVATGIFLDASVTKEGDFSFVTALRENVLTDDLPIIVTAKGLNRSQVMDAVRCGATYIALKPLTDELVTACFNVAMNRHPRYRATHQIEGQEVAPAEEPSEASAEASAEATSSADTFEPEQAA